MPYIPHTPESLVARYDSKNPATTCKGITSNGRPCRRSLAASPGASPSRTSPGPRRGILAVVPTDEPEATRSFCWQHKEQAEKKAHEIESAVRPKNAKSTNNTLPQRSSIDTLVDRIGILNIDSKVTNAKAIEEIPKYKNRRERKKPGLLSVLCCIQVDYDDDERETIPQPSRLQMQGNIATPVAKRPPLRPGQTVTPNKTMVLQHNEKMSHRPSLARDPSSQTERLLSFIPNHLSPQTTSLLLTEMAKPISAYDGEGYIYIFWLTDSDINSAPSPKAVSDLLAPASRPYNHGRRPSEVLQAASTTSARQAQGKSRSTILLKIGRASNVHRRMNEWTRQCGYNLSLIRYYPHVPSSSPGSSPFPSPSASSPPDSGPRKIPNAHRVERLIHIELADSRVKQGSCDKCGKEHREWFAVEANREGLRAVDETVRRWVDWGNMQSRN